MTDSVNDEAVYRTAPATPGLLKICIYLKHILTTHGSVTNNYMRF